MDASGPGSTLRRARETRRLSVDDIADRTKIAPHILEAIDSDALDHVPKGVFARGYLRAYAREVGVDSETLIGDYLAEQDDTGEDVLDQLRKRFRLREPGRGHQLELVLVIVAVVCLLVILSRSPEQSADNGDLRDQPAIVQTDHPG
jgi:cytoskeleton protein RodZ